MTLGSYIRANDSFSGCDMVISVDMILPGGKKITQVVGSVQTLSYSIHMEKIPVRAIGNINAKAYTHGPRTIAGSLVLAVFDKHFARGFIDSAKKSAGENHHLLMDEMPPMNITISMANEYGKKGRLALYGIQFVNEGQVMSINDVYTENTYQYVATGIEYLNDGQTALSGGRQDANRAQVSHVSYSNQSMAPAPLREKRTYSEIESYIDSIEDGVLSFSLSASAPKRGADRLTI